MSMSKWKHILLVIATVFACIGCDQTTKVVASDALPRDRVLSFAGDTVRLRYAENRGAFLSLGDDMPQLGRSLLLVGAVGVGLAAFLAFLLRASSLNAFTLVACSLLCGGGIGNWIDRVSPGYVVDFLECGIGRVRTGIFNVADLAITTGALMLFAGALVRRRAHPNV